MRDILLIGINHKTAPVELRECMAFSTDEASTAIDALRRMACIQEVLLYSTCNRVELLVVTEDRSQAIATAKQFLSDFNKIPLAEFEGSLYVHANDDAVRHLFRVAASLDSMVVGEPQILGQIKEAYRGAAQAKSAGVVLNRLMHGPSSSPSACAPKPGSATARCRSATPPSSWRARSSAAWRTSACC